MKILLNFIVILLCSMCLTAWGQFDPSKIPGAHAYYDMELWRVYGSGTISTGSLDRIDSTKNFIGVYANGNFVKTSSVSTYLPNRGMTAGSITYQTVYNDNHNVFESPSGGYFTGKDEFGLSFWYYKVQGDQNANNDGLIASCTTFGDSSLLGVVSTAGTDANNYWSAAYSYDGDSYSGYMSSTLGSLEVQHINVTYKDGHAFAFKNGVLIGSSTISSITQPSLFALRWGSKSWVNRQLAAVFDDVTFWLCANTPEEASLNYRGVYKHEGNQTLNNPKNDMSDQTSM